MSSSVNILRPKSNEEWKELRKGGIGSSEIATILGLNEYETPYELWLRKTGQIPPKEENNAMMLGHFMEDAVAQMWAKQTGREIIKRSKVDFIIQDKELPFLQVSPDRTYWINEGRSHDNKGILECKTTQKYIVDNQFIPDYWICQLQYQLEVAGLKRGSLAWLSRGRDFGYLDIEHDQFFCEFLVEKATKFYKDCIIGGKEPELLRPSDVLKKYPQHTQGLTEINIDSQTMLNYNKYKDIRKAIESLEEQKKHLEDELKMAIGASEGLICGGNTLITWKAPAPTAKFDAKRFEKENGDLYRQYLVETQGARRFVVK